MAPQVNVYQCFIEEELPIPLFQKCLHKLPLHLHASILAFKHWQGRQSALIGKLLLQKAVLDMDKLPQLENMLIGEHQKPYFQEGPFFNISHSGAYVVCAVSTEAEIGIDIEKTRPIEHAKFSRVFSEEELFEINSNIDPEKAFFRKWTQKEAVLKALGSGMSISPKLILCEGEKAFLKDGTTWVLSELPIHMAYACWLACSGNVKPQINSYNFSITE